jgi:hypothetical protein
LMEPLPRERCSVGVRDSAGDEAQLRRLGPKTIF